MTKCKKENNKKVELVVLTVV